MSKIIIAPMILILLFSGCMGSKVKDINYYLIELPANIYAGNGHSDPLSNDVCQIDQVDVYPAFSSTRIAFRKQSHEITYYAYHKWAVKPAETFTRLLQEQLERSSIFKLVSTRFWKIEPTYDVVTKIYQLEAVQDKQKQLHAHLNMEFMLVDHETQKQRIVHSADKTQRLEENNMNLFSKTVSHLYFLEMQQFSSKIIEMIQDESDN